MPDSINKYILSSLFLTIICLLAIIYMVATSGNANMLKTTVTGFGDIDIREQVTDNSVRVAALAANSTAKYLSVAEWGQIVKFSNSFQIFGAQASGGFRNQYVISGSGGGNTFEYRATAVIGDFVGGGELILRGSAHPDEHGNTLEARITLDASGGKSIFDIDVVNVTTGRPVTAFELNGVGNWTFQQYLLLNETQKEKFEEEDFCESLDRILPRDFSGYYIAPHGKKLTADADLVDSGVDESNLTPPSTIGRFAAEQANLDEYRAAHPEEFEEK